MTNFYLDSLVTFYRDNMPDTSTSDPQIRPQATALTNVSGGVNVDANQVTIGGDVIGRDKITTIGYTAEQVSTLLTQISSTFQPQPFDGRCPYLGLDAFTEDTPIASLAARPW